MTPMAAPQALPEPHICHVCPRNSRDLCRRPLRIIMARMRLSHSRKKQFFKSQHEYPPVKQQEARGQSNREPSDFGKSCRSSLPTSVEIQDRGLDSLHPTDMMQGFFGAGIVKSANINREALVPYSGRRFAFGRACLSGHAQGINCIPTTAVCVYE